MLEVVQIQHQQRRELALAVRHGLRHGPPCGVLVQKLGQSIPLGPVTEGHLGTLHGIHVLQHADDTPQLSLLVELRHAADVGPEILGIFVGDAHIEGEGGVLLGGAANGLPHDGQVVGVEMGGDAHLRPVIFRHRCVAEVLLPLGGAVHGVAGHIPLEDDAVGLVDDGAVALQIVLVAELDLLHAAVVGDGVVAVHSSVRLYEATGLVQHPTHRAVLPLEAVDDLAACQIPRQFTDGGGYGEAVGFVDHLQIPSAEEGVDLLQGIAGEGEQSLLSPV